MGACPLAVPQRGHMAAQHEKEGVTRAWPDKGPHTAGGPRIPAPGRGRHGSRACARLFLCVEHPLPGADTALTSPTVPCGPHRLLSCRGMVLASEEHTLEKSQRPGGWRPGGEMDTPAPSPSFGKRRERKAGTYLTFRSGDEVGKGGRPRGQAPLPLSPLPRLYDGGLV